MGSIAVPCVGGGDVLSQARRSEVNASSEDTFVTYLSGRLLLAAAWFSPNRDQDEVDEWLLVFTLALSARI